MEVDFGQVPGVGNLKNSLRVQGEVHQQAGSDDQERKMDGGGNSGAFCVLPDERVEVAEDAGDSAAEGQLKNKFYSFLRSFILKVLQHQKQLKSFRVNSISSKAIKQLFEGTDEFVKFSGKITEYLESIQYEITSQKIEQLLNRRESEIKQILKLLFRNSSKSISGQATGTRKGSIIRRRNDRCLQKQRQNREEDFGEESDSKNYSQKKQGLQQMKGKIGGQEFCETFKKRKVQAGFLQNGPKLQQFKNPKTSEKESFANLEKKEQKILIEQSQHIDWPALPYQFPFYGMDNCYGRYQPQNDETIVSRQEGVFFYCVPYNGQQAFYYRF